MLRWTPDEARSVSDDWLAAVYDDLNRVHFDAALPFVPIWFAPDSELPGEMEKNGNTHLRVDPNGTGVDLLVQVSEWLLGASDRSLVDKMVSDTILHEMVHVSVYLDALESGEPPEDGHGERFTAECNRIGETTGWGVVRPELECEPGFDDDVDAAYWPRNLRGS